MLAWDVPAAPKKIETERNHNDEEHWHDERLDADTEPLSGWGGTSAEPIDTAEASGLKRFGASAMCTGSARTQVMKAVQRHVLLVRQVHGTSVAGFGI